MASSTLVPSGSGRAVVVEVEVEGARPTGAVAPPGVIAERCIADPGGWLGRLAEPRTWMPADIIRLRTVLPSGGSSEGEGDSPTMGNTVDNEIGEIQRSIGLDNLL